MEKYNFGVSLTPDMLQLFNRLQVFYQTKKRSRLVEQLFLFAVFDVANLPEHSAWTKAQQRAWRYCQNFATDFKELFTWQQARKISVCTLQTMQTSELRAFAKEKGIRCHTVDREQLLKQLEKVL
jgi:hypothetical protein